MSQPTASKTPAESSASDRASRAPLIEEERRPAASASVAEPPAGPIDSAERHRRICETAYDLFDRLLALRNDVGLLAEQYDPVARRLVGNFPQAFSHVSLVNTAVRLDRARVGADATSLGVEDIPEELAEELAEMAEDQG
jgi:hypothetical protein